MSEKDRSPIHLRIPNEDRVSNVIIPIGILFLFSGIFFLILHEMVVSGRSEVNFTNIQYAISEIWFYIIIYLALVVLSFYLYTKFMDYVLQHKYGFFPYRLYMVISYAISVLSIFATLMYTMMLIEGLTIIFASLWFITDGYSHKYYEVDVKIDRSSHQIEYIGNFSKFLFIPAKEVNVLTGKDSSEPFDFFIRVKGLSILDERYLTHVKETKRFDLEIKSLEILDKLPFEDDKLLRFECYLFFDRIENNGTLLENFYIPIGKFQSKDNLIEFLNQLSNSIDLRYTAPDESKISGKNR